MSIDVIDLQLMFTEQSADEYRSSYKEAEDNVIREAISILETRVNTNSVFTMPNSVKDFCRLNLATEEYEYFCCLFLDTRHRLIKFERLFSGTIDGASVYPRVIARRALELNAAAIIVTHNHPSGDSTPSEADKRITIRLRNALELFDIRLLDHIIVSLADTLSFAERGLV